MTDAATRPAPPERPQPDEPEITQEESVPSDGKDEEGEKMMEELGQKRARDGAPAAPPKP